MKIRTLRSGGLAKDCRTNIHFKEDEVLCEGDKGLELKHLERLIEVGYAVVETGSFQETIVSEKKEAKKEARVAEREEKPEKSQKEENEQNSQSIDLTALSKEELDEYAKEKFSVELDRRKSKANMIKELNEKIGE